MARKKTQTDSDDELNFEDAIGELQEIVRQFEEGELGLDESLQQFEAGVRLLRKCHSKLDQAEQKIKVLTDVDANGNPIVSDFDDSSTIEQNQQSAGRRKKKKPAAGEEKSSESEGSSLF